VSHSKDDTKILESTVLNPIGESLRRISHGGHFIVYSDTNDSLGLMSNLNVSFVLTNTCKILCIAVILHLVSLYFQENVSEQSLVCSVACQILIVGDLKYYAQLLGRENMSSSWCIWCTSHPSTWKQYPVPDAEHWTIEKIKSIKGRIDRKELKEPRELLGVVSNPVWDFVQPQNYIFPELHAEIGLVNNVLDNFYTFIDDRVEALTPEEWTSRNSFISITGYTCLRS
jgi:hypothetical protein